MKTYFLLSILFFLSYSTFSQNNPGDVLSYIKINSLTGGLGNVLDDSDGFGGSSSVIGDVNNDGIDDIIVGAVNDDDGGTDKRAVYILFMDTNFTVKSKQKISATQGNFTL